jgi:hypothetical protein
VPGFPVPVSTGSLLIFGIPQLSSPIPIDHILPFSRIRVGIFYLLITEESGST